MLTFYYDHNVSAFIFWNQFSTLWRNELLKAFTKFLQYVFYIVYITTLWTPTTFLFLEGQPWVPKYDRENTALRFSCYILRILKATCHPFLRPIHQLSFVDVLCLADEGENNQKNKIYRVYGVSKLWHSDKDNLLRVTQAFLEEDDTHQHTQKRVDEISQAGFHHKTGINRPNVCDPVDG